MRTRTNQAQPESVVLTNTIVTEPDMPDPSGYGVNGSGSLTEEFCNFSEDMVDVDHGFGRENACAHLKTTTQLLPFGPSVSSLTRKVSGVFKPWYTVTFRNFSYATGAQYMTSILDAYSYGSSHWAASESWFGSMPNYAPEALEAMWPQVKSEMSLINSVYELKDFKSLPKLLGQTVGLFHNKRIPALQRLGLGNLNKMEKGKPLSNLLNVSSSHYLNYMFAVAPLVSDIKAAIAALKNAQRGLKRLRESAGKTLHSHYVKYLDADSFGLSATDIESGYQFYSQPQAYKVVKLGTKVRYGASMHYTFTIPLEVGRLASLLAELDAFGVNLNPAIVWNAIPFSFVVDWFLKVGNSLNRLRVRALPVNVVIHGFSHSLQYNADTEIRIYPYQGLVDYNNSHPTDHTAELTNRMPGQVMARRRRSVYMRTPVEPSFVGTPRWSDFSTTEKWLTGALFVSWATGRKH